MKTDELVRLLAAGVGASEPHAARCRYAVALAWGAFGTTLLMAIRLGVRPDIATAMRLTMFWVKLALPASLAVGALLAAGRLSRPGARLGRGPLALVVPVLLVWLLAAIDLLQAAPEQRSSLILGATATDCLVYVTVLSLPMMAGAFWAMMGLAPTRLWLAGAAAGLLAGATGALLYALHCPEMQASFIGVWYVAGMLIPTLAGAILGPNMLRW